MRGWITWERERRRRRLITRDVEGERLETAAEERDDWHDRPDRSDIRVTQQMRVRNYYTN